MRKIAASFQVSWFCFALLLWAPVGLAEVGLPARVAFQPLSGQEKFDYYVQHTFAMRDFLERSALAGIAQWRDSPPRVETGMGRIWPPPRFKLWPVFHQEDPPVRRWSCSQRRSAVFRFYRKWILETHQPCGKSHSNGEERF
jgi:hypothetical protein